MDPNCEMDCKWSLRRCAKWTKEGRRRYVRWIVMGTEEIFQIDCNEVLGRYVKLFVKGI